MRSFPFFILAISLVSSQALAQPKPLAKPAKPPAASNAPKLIGKFDDWKVATHVEAGQLVCYMLTPAASSVPAVSGRGDVTLTVTQRPGATRDAVAISTGIVYPPNASVAVQADTNAFEFYTAARSAFSRDGHASVAAFLKAKQVLARSPNPKGGTVTDQFSLRGFNAAYTAMNKACPAK
jgi:hypothetical protein